MKKISKQYYLISSILTDITSKLENLRTNEPGRNSLEEIDSLFTKFSLFPLKNAEDLNTIEGYLVENNNFRAAVSAP